MGGLPMKDELCSRKAVLAAVTDEATMLEMAAGADPIWPEFATAPTLVTVQFCACAPNAPNSEAASAAPVVTAMPRPLRRTELADFTDSTVACPVGTARKALVNMEPPI